jgi:hypothetical protein
MLEKLAREVTDLPPLMTNGQPYAPIERPVVSVLHVENAGPEITNARGQFSCMLFRKFLGSFLLKKLNMGNHLHLTVQLNCNY